MNFTLEEYDLLKQYDVDIIGNSHYYNLKFSRTNYDLDYSKPLYFKVGMTFFRINIWQKLVLNVLTYFIVSLNLQMSNLSKFSCNWTKRTVFSPICEDERYWKKIGSIGYIYLNFTSTHLYFLLTDFLKYIEIENEQVEFLVSLASNFEPLEIYNLFYNKNLYELKLYLKHEKNYNQEKEIAFLSWLKIIDKRLNAIAPSKKSILTIEDSNDLSTIYSKLRKCNPYKVEEKIKAYNYVLKSIVEMKKRLINNK